ncbi:MAG: hypothetical protein HKN85_03885 [Gammaproteobacteria bacterium]|nr:hypothetical protein [Gammaproteobacteria bacterium]
MQPAVTIFRAFRPPARSWVAAFCLILCAISSASYARDYKVEVLIFENLGEHRAYESYRYQEIEKMSSAAETWFIQPSMLTGAATAISQSSELRLLTSYSWGQESLPYSQSAVFNLIEADLTGWIKIYANHLLYANLDLDYNGYRLQEKRRLKLDEKHFFDHPKFGVLLQVSRLEPPPETLENQDAEISENQLQESPGGSFPQTDNIKPAKDSDREPAQLLEIQE